MVKSIMAIISLCIVAKLIQLFYLRWIPLNKMTGNFAAKSPRNYIYFSN